MQKYAFFKNSGKKTRQNSFFCAFFLIICIDVCKFLLYLQYRINNHIY